MSSPNQIDGVLLAPPSNPRTPGRSAQNLIRPPIVIEPTEESQQFYNQTRREMDRQRLEQHVEDNNLEPPAAEPMSRSTTSDSYPSPSTVCSQSCNSIPASSPDPIAEAVRSKPHRGRRKGPLDLETRTKIAYKRKFKLTCDYHRAKRTSCNCHDFSKLEEGYRKDLAAQEQKAKAARSHSVRSFREGDIETFSTGGGVPPLTTPQYPSLPDLSDLHTDRELPSRVHENLLPALRLDIDSAESVSEFMSAPREEPNFFAPGISMPASGQGPFEPVTIGCTTLYHKRWQCEYKYKTEETEPGRFADSCSWTGPFEQLEAHFRTEHHPFQPAEAPEWSMCEECKQLTLGWEEPGCHLGRSTKFFYGAVLRQVNPNPPFFTLSEASGSRSSWLNPSWNMPTPGSSNTEQSNLPHSSANSRSGFYAHSASGNESSEAGDTEGSDDNINHEPMRGGMQHRSRDQSDAVDSIGHCRLRSWLRVPAVKIGAKSALYRSHPGLIPFLKPYRRMAFSPLAPLAASHLQSIHAPTELGKVLIACRWYVVFLMSYLAVATVVASLIVWVAVESLKVRAKDGSSALAAVL